MSINKWFKIEKFVLNLKLYIENGLESIKAQCLIREMCFFIWFKQ